MGRNDHYWSYFFNYLKDKKKMDILTQQQYQNLRQQHNLTQQLQQQLEHQMFSHQQLAVQHCVGKSNSSTSTDVEEFEREHARVKEDIDAVREKMERQHVLFESDYARVKEDIERTQALLD